MSDSTSAVWTLALGTDFTEVLWVDIQAINANTQVAGIRQASLNAWTSTSTTLTGNTYGNSVIATVLLSAANSMQLIGGTTVLVRVQGVGT